LRDRILGGELRAGDAVPSERELAGRWRVARPTAARALAELRRLGVVESRVGAGSFVTAVPVARSAGDLLRRSAATGAIYPLSERAEILDASLVEPPDGVRLALGLGPGERAARRERLTRREDVPIEWSTSWFSEATAAKAPRMLNKARIRQGTMLYVEERTGRRVASAEDRFSARRATAHEARLLCLPRSSAVLCGEYRVIDRRGDPLEFAESVRPGGVWTEMFRTPLRPG
jgi:DNA-binding GntR family transcriptional regulator